MKLKREGGISMPDAVWSRLVDACRFAWRGRVSNRGRWGRKFGAGSVEFCYGDPMTYRLGADFLADLPSLEDWGCGLGGFRRFCRAAQYQGIDGTPSRFSDVVADLVRYRSSTEGIFIRHVMEHNYRWKTILDNAVASFRRKMCLVLFTPFQKRTRLLAVENPGRPVPVIGFRKQDLTERFRGVRWDLLENLRTETQYGIEHIFFLEKGRAS